MATTLQSLHSKSPSAACVHFLKQFVLFAFVFFANVTFSCRFSNRIQSTNIDKRVTLMKLGFKEYILNAKDEKEPVLGAPRQRSEETWAHL